MVDIASGLDRFIALDRRALKIYVAFGTFVLVLGVALVVASFVFSSSMDDGIGGLLGKLGGGFIATLSTLPLKEYLARRDRIVARESIKAQWHALNESPDPSEEDLTRLQQIMLNIYEKAASR